jgi:hypothetical protein
MKTSRYTEGQIIAILWQAEGGVPVQTSTGARCSLRLIQNLFLDCGGALDFRNTPKIKSL